MTSTENLDRQDDSVIERLLSLPESYIFDCKRITGKVDKLLETVIAFANADGGMIAIGMEDPDKGTGRDRLYGVDEHPMNWDELQRKLRSRITEPDQLLWTPQEVACTLRNGVLGSVILLKIRPSTRVHSIVDDGTFIRLSKGNKELTAHEINDLCYSRGVVSAETQLEDIDFELLETDLWRAYARHRKLTRNIDQAMFHVGLAKKNREGELKPLRAAVLLFADDPSGLLAAKAAIRLFHYSESKKSTDPNTNLVRPPMTIGGPVIRQIRDATDAVISELAGGIQYGPLGFEIVQRYPKRVIVEAITNAVIHRDYRLPSDVMIRIFSDRIEVESPGLLIGPVRTGNIASIGTYARNKLLVQHLREFPDPPNLDAGEGVPMMFGAMRQAGLYPPLYWTRPKIEREAVRVYLWNQNRPSVWEQVNDYLQQHGTIGNAEVRQILQTDDPIRTSRQLKEWVNLGLLEVANPESARKMRRYRKTGTESNPDLFSRFF